MSPQRTPGPKRRRLHARAFGLIEVMFSAALLAAAMTATLSTILTLDAVYAHERLLTNALHVGEATMEGLLLRYGDDPQLAATNGTPRAGPSFGINGLPGGTFFSTSWEVVLGVPIAGTREVTVIVTWTERGKVKKFRLTSART